ncbi:TPA: hypothetical protein DEP58_00500 [Patescibacteria group bacterium]|nr:MAG: hypothetical protein UU98_C0026G0015 [Parcubacteria group bacterium GW2011_GWD2_42_14]HCC04768.1 hypothetical protein [Patescibacteria group bacterium]
MSAVPQTHTSAHGYTMMEMLVVIAIISIIMPVLFSSIQSLYTTHAKTLSRALAVIETTKGVQEVVRDVRAAVYSENGAVPIVAIATSSLTLYSDTDYDGDVERIRYFLNGTTFTKGVIEPTATSSYPTNTETFLDIVHTTATSTPLFRYFTASSTEIVSPSQAIQVRRVEVQLVGSTRFGLQTSEVALRSSASIRNLKDTY